MITIRKSADRGAADHGWLRSHHTFSFASYYDPRHIHFRQLRVINEDFVAPKTGFPTHGHDNMEIITYVVSGAVAHQDSMGNTTTILAGEVQVMSAGSGITHSEMNPSETEWLHLFQIWIFPKASNTTPSYQQRAVSKEERRNQLACLVHPGGAGDGLQIGQDAFLFGTLLDENAAVAYSFSPRRYALVHVVSGDATVNGKRLNMGDAAMISEESRIEIQAVTECEVLLFDLA